jgi:hypothetical protein
MIWTGASSAGFVAGLGTSDIYVSGSEPATLTLDVIAFIDANGLLALGLDLEFDRAPELGDELNVLHATNLLRQRIPGGGGALGFPPLARTQESTADNEGQLFGFQFFTLGVGPSNATLASARAIFTTNPPNVQSDGDDIFATNESDPFATVAFDNRGQLIPFPLPRASVNLIPEPASAWLVGLGLAALGAAAARSRRR